MNPKNSIDRNRAERLEAVGGNALLSKFQVVEALEKLEKEVRSYEAPAIELTRAQTEDPFKILIAALLSARTNDKTTIIVLKKLFAAVESPADLDSLSVAEIEKLIYPVGFYRNKAKYLKRLPKILRDKFKGDVPERIEDLLQLPGVGRKTANLVRGAAFKKPAVCVDIHVHRIMNRLGCVETKTPFETEMEIRKKLPPELWIQINSTLVPYGQNLCRPVKPHCGRCVVSDICLKIGVSSSR